MHKAAGFTLIEALVALVVLALTAVALLGVAEAHVARINGLESRAIAQWVAENRLVELQIGGRTEQGPFTTMLGRDWRVSLSRKATADPELTALEIRVTEAGTEQPQAIFGGFIDAVGAASL